MRLAKKHITGIVLAGGKSSRMGQDKGLILLNGKAFIQYVIDALQPLCSQIIIVSNNTDYDVFQQRRVDDLIADSGPMAGLYTGLHYSKTEYNLALSCDIPLINTAVLKELIQQSHKDAAIVQLRSGGRVMPLIALYKRHCKENCRSLLKSGERSLCALVNRHKTQTVILDKVLEMYTVNVNTPIQLKKISYANNH